VAKPFNIDDLLTSVNLALHQDPRHDAMLLIEKAQQDQEQEGNTPEGHSSAASCPEPPAAADAGETKQSHGGKQRPK
jgi:hypothetical protein